MHISLKKLYAPNLLKYVCYGKKTNIYSNKYSKGDDFAIFIKEYYIEIHIQLFQMEKYIILNPSMVPPGE